MRQRFVDVYFDMSGNKNSLFSQIVFENFSPHPNSQVLDIVSEHRGEIVMEVYGSDHAEVYIARAPLNIQ